MFLKIRGRGVLAVRFRNKGLKKYLYMFFVNFLLFTALSSRERGAQVMLYDVSGDTLCVCLCACHNFVSEKFIKMYTF